ncbi:MAG: copper homeostasis protein CutC [Candidatus Sulfotelmatobacter sp.]
MSDQIAIEVCVDSVASALAAEQGGARRVELCSNLLEGGVTPSAGLIELVRARTSIGLQVMIRPRGGDFFYTPEEFETMRRDITVARKLGADGVVLGILHPNGRVDTERTRQLVDLARPLSVTFHRAFDMSADLLCALEDVCTTGADRLLTSGGEQTAGQAVEPIAQLVKSARGRMAIMAGGGIDQHNAASIIEQTGVREIHVGLRSPATSPMVHRQPRISMGTAPGREYQRFQVLAENVLSLHRAVALARI